jgi:hypothetical protein
MWLPFCFYNRSENNRLTSNHIFEWLFFSYIPVLHFTVKSPIFFAHQTLKTICYV